MCLRGFDGLRFSLGNSWGSSLVTEGKMLVERAGFWDMVVVHLLIPSPWAISSEEALFGEGCPCLNGREERICR